jgi:hypothetical protein
MEQRKGHRRRSAGVVGHAVQEVKLPAMNRRVMQLAVGAAESMLVHVDACATVPEDATAPKVVVFFLITLDSFNTEGRLAVMEPLIVCERVS